MVAYPYFYHFCISEPFPLLTPLSLSELWFFLGWCHFTVRLLWAPPEQGEIVYFRMYLTVPSMVHGTQCCPADTSLIAWSQTCLVYSPWGWSVVLAESQWKTLLSDSIATKGTLKGSFNDVQVELFESSAIHHDSLFNKLVTSLLEGSSAKETIETIEKEWWELF